MKTFLILTCLGVAGLGFLSRSAVKVSEATKSEAKDGDSFRIGLLAITGQLTAERIAELEKHVTAPQSIAEIRPIPAHTPEPLEAPVRLETPKAHVLEAWSDLSGCLWVRMDDGRTYLRLDSGELILAHSTVLQNRSETD